MLGAASSTALFTHKVLLLVFIRIVGSVAGKIAYPLGLLQFRLLLVRVPRRTSAGEDGIYDGTNQQLSG